MTSLSTDTVTFLFTDIEGSPKFWRLHPDTMLKARARRRAGLSSLGWNSVSHRVGGVFPSRRLIALTLSAW